MLKHFARWGALGCAVVGAGLFWLSSPRYLVDETFLDLTGNADHGEILFKTAGCGSCHTSPDLENSESVDLSGGKAFETQFGTFYAPNISTDPIHGIGGWSDLELANAIVSGVSNNGAHLYPALPYTSYAKANPQDIRDLIAYWRTLPAATVASRPHDVGFPFSVRRGLGLWKRAYSTTDWALEEASDETVARGRYLVETLGHCGECHTPRNLFGGIVYDEWLSGAALPSGEGRVPGITPAQLNWSVDEVAEYLSSGFTPEYDTAGGEMVDVIDNLSALTSDDRKAIAEYLATLGL